MYGQLRHRNEVILPVIVRDEQDAAAIVQLKEIAECMLECRFEFGTVFRPNRTEVKPSPLAASLRRPAIVDLNQADAGAVVHP